MYENLRKTDPIVELTLPQPVPLCGDIKIEFFHNTRGWKKVGCVCVCVETRLGWELVGQKILLSSRYLFATDELGRR